MESKAITGVVVKAFVVLVLPIKYFEGCTQNKYTFKHTWKSKLTMIRHKINEHLIFFQDILGKHILTLLVKPILSPKKTEIFLSLSITSEVLFFYDD